jgi:hypothetical protein
MLPNVGRWRGWYKRELLNCQMHRVGWAETVWLNIRNLGACHEALRDDVMQKRPPKSLNNQTKKES